MDLRAYVGRPSAIKQLVEYSKIDGQPMPLLGLPTVRLIFQVFEAVAIIQHAWFPDLAPPNNTRDFQG